ncbi:hypothetical protein ACH5RR_036098 [Cinchona calisaya]|uniref:Uncharacterized protein n=1 Tax=Cinchona calisaya TaxID=153742 RepID=A0ABD2Y700_9GENT
MIFRKYGIHLLSRMEHLTSRAASSVVKLIINLTSGVCFEEQIDTVLLPCRHNILCRYFMNLLAVSISFASHVVFFLLFPRKNFTLVALHGIEFSNIYIKIEKATRD